MMLAEAYLFHRDALRASLLSEYRVTLGDRGALETAALVAWLPPGSALWRAFGGPLSLSDESARLDVIEYRLRVIAWQRTSDGGKGINRPEPPKAPPLASEKRSNIALTEKKAAAWRRRAASRE